VELLLTVTFAAPGSPGAVVAADVEVDIDAEVPLVLLRDELVRHAAHRGLADAGGLADAALLLITAGEHRPLDLRASVFNAGIVSGNRLAVVPAAVPAGAAPRVAGDPVGAPVYLDVSAGPATGRSIPLPPGRHTIGRAVDCSVPIDDSALSSYHCAVVVNGDGTVWLDPNPAATNGTIVAGVVATEARWLEPEADVVVGTTQFVVRSATTTVVGDRDRLGQISFNRVPYRRPVIGVRTFDELDAPPEPPEPRRLAWWSIALPLVMAGAFVRYTGQAGYAVIALMSPVMVVASHLSERGIVRGRHQRAVDGFRASVEQRAGELRAAVGDEHTERWSAAPDVPQLARQAERRLARLWERPRAAPDFLDLRLGLGRRPTRISSPVRKGGAADLRAWAAERLAFHHEVDEVPVTVSLAGDVVTGIYGPRAEADAVARSLVVQAACLHSPEDLVVVAAVPDGHEPSWSWLKWLPHTRSATSPVAGDHLVGPSATDRLLVRLADVVATRAGTQDHPGRLWPRVLVLLHEAARPDRVLLATLLDQARAGGLVVLWLGSDEHDLPRQCEALVRCSATPVEPSLLWFTDPERPSQPVTATGVSPDVAGSVARSLAPVRDASAGTATTSIPRLVALLDAIGLRVPEPSAVAARWAEPRPYGLRARIGMGPDGPFAVDLVEQGPHTLIAGTSGSGKSELLQTLVLALAADHPPERLNFLFVDYKGGASSAALRDLPHTVGSVTNLDERLARRALASLRAELQRRMALMENRAKDLPELLAVAPTEAPPSLVLVVDEFATLVKEIPDFVAGMVDIAQRGRSLGIHLVLATQRPTGAVNDNILANTNLRIALRVLDASESSAILGSREAADLPVPLRGRAYARTGPGALAPFQTAWSGAPYRPDGQRAMVTVRPFPLIRPEDTDDGAGVASPPGGPPALSPPAADPDTQLEIMVRAAAAAARATGRPAPRRPWVEPLPALVTLDAFAGPSPDAGSGMPADPGRFALVGLADEPARQSQYAATVDLEATGGLIIYGTGGSGKTTLLRTIAAGLARQGPPSAVQLYGLDFAGRSLDQLLALPHTVVPRIVVLLDSYSGFHSTFENGALYQWIMELQRLVAEGRQVGVHVVMTTDRQLGVPTALTSAVGGRIVLRLPTPEDLIGAGVPREMARGAELGAGRGFLDATIELQAAVVSADPGGAAQAQALAADGARLAATYGERARTLPELPPVWNAEPRLAGPLQPVAGVADLTLEPVLIDLRRDNCLITGGPASGRSTLAGGIAAALAADPAGPCVVGLGGAASPLAGLDCWDIAGFGRATHAAALDKVVDLVAGDEGTTVRAVVVMDAVEDLEAMELTPRLDELLRSDVARVVAVAEVSTLGRAYSGWLSELRRVRTVAVLQPGSPADVETAAGVMPALRPGQSFPPGRGVLVVRRVAKLVQFGVPAGTPLAALGSPPQ
jgi:S-DNA-T family DNA segregation ATPase FtsK/SpoIIIE